MKNSYITKFLSRIKKCSNGCWEYQGAPNEKGYTRIRLGKGRREYVHRVSYELHFGPIPNDKIVMHKCDNPICVNPDHLQLGTKLENALDRDIKNRTAKGEKSGKAKLSNAQVLEIKQLLEQKVNRKEIAKLFNVSETPIYQIQNGKRFSDF